MASVWSTSNMPLVRSTVGESMQRAAEAQANMYGNVGRALGEVGSAYFEKKDEDAQIEAAMMDGRFDKFLFKGRTVPTDPKEKKKVYKAAFRGMGGRKGIEQLFRLDSAEQRAAQQGEMNALLLQKMREGIEADKSYTESLFARPEVTIEELTPIPGTEAELIESRGGEQVFPPPPPSLAPIAPGEEMKYRALRDTGSPAAPTPQYAPLPEWLIENIENRQSGGLADERIVAEFEEMSRNPDPRLQTHATAIRSYLPAIRAHLGGEPAAVAAPEEPPTTYGEDITRSIEGRLGGAGIGAAGIGLEQLEQIRVPTELPTQEVKRPGESLIHRVGAERMTGPVFLEAWNAQNPNASIGMKQKAVATASSLPQRAPQPAKLRTEGGMQWLEDEYGKPLFAPTPITQRGKIGKEARDRAFASKMVDFNPQDVRKGLQQLKLASDALAESDTLTGPWVSMIPGFIGDRANPQATEVREAVQEVVQRNLRLVLGAAFTEREGEALIARAFNPKLSEKENKSRVDRLFTQIYDATEDHLKKVAYFEKHNTLEGYTGPSVEEILGEFGMMGATGAEAPQLRASEEIISVMLDELGDPNDSPGTYRANIIRLLPGGEKNEEFAASGTPETMNIVYEKLREKLGDVGGGGAGAAKPGDGEPAPNLIKIGEITVPSPDAIRSANLDGKGEFIKILSSVMREAIETGALKKEDFEGSPTAWYGEFPDPFNPTNYRMLIEYAGETVGHKGEDHPNYRGQGDAAARNMGMVPLPGDKDLFDYLNEYSDVFEERTRFPE